MYSAEDMIRVETAREKILSVVRTMPTERVGLISCLGRVLAQEIASDIDIASFENSAMDGFALRFEDVQIATEEAPVSLPIVGYIGAGMVFPDALRPGQAVRIMTGAPMPAGADTVVKIEDVEVIGVSADLPAGLEVCSSKPVIRGKNVRLRGEDAKAGEILFLPGDRISSAVVGMLAASGNTEVSVYERPRVAIFSTGSELVGAAEIPGPGQIRDSNCHSLAAAALDAGALATVFPRVEDTREALVSTLAELTRAYDLVVLSGGAAEGDFDYTVSSICELGEVLFTKVSMRPGKAQILGVIDGVPVFGLSGNPIAAIVGFEILVRPAIRKMLGFENMLRPIAIARVTKDIKKKEERRFYLRGRLERDTSGALIVTPAGNQSSALLSTYYGSNCLLEVPEGKVPIKAGDEVRCICINLPEGEVI
ncbi:MAG: molybdopterin molybdotransferase MoeA [Coriobacteriia bacterium]|nr:molybdopterin molybdotransferase MoeA [Coriobacteriia bacterium]